MSKAQISAKKTNQLIDTAIKSAGSTRKAIQEAAIAILVHALHHSDYSGAGRLVQGLKDKGVRRDALVLYFQGYGGLIVNEDKETQADKPFSGWFGKEHIREHLEQAKATYWDSVKKEADPFENFDLNVELAKLIKKAERVTKKVVQGNFQGKAAFTLDNSLLDQLNAISKLDNVNTDQDAQVIDKLEQLLSGNVEGDNNEGGAQDTNAA